MSDAPHTVTAAALSEINCSIADFVNDMKRLTLKLTGLRRQPGVSSHCVWQSTSSPLDMVVRSYTFAARSNSLGRCMVTSIVEEVQDGGGKYRDK